ncbi:MAG: thioredoxin family protein, partial [Nitrospinales bacterium]
EFDGRLRVGKLNVDDNPFTTERYGIRGIPSLVLFKEGRLVRQITGVRSTEVIRQILNQAL